MSTTINPALYSGALYQLPTSGDASTTTTSSQTNPTASLLAALDPTSTQDSSSSPTDLVSLSPEAQSILSGLGLSTGSSTSSSIGSIGSSTGSSTSATAAGSGFILSAQQQQQITAILEKYKDAPFTQATYNDIQNDLKSAGLSPDTLSMQDEMRSFNPTQILVDALNGVTDPTVNPLNDPTEQSNANSYMQQIMGEWKNISTTAGAATATGTTGSGTAATTSVSA